MKVIDTLEELASRSACVVLYSGGVDSSYLLWFCREHGVRAVAMQALLGAEDQADVARAARTANALGAELVTLDLTDELAERFLPPAIRAGGTYHGAFPICSSITRPLIAEAAVRVAREAGVDCVVHSATWVQNSSARFNNSLHVLAPEVVVGNPFAAEPIDRERKIEALRGAGIEMGERGVYSIDANLWGRVIEAGELDDPSFRIPERVFEWTSSARTDEEVEVELTFREGIPVALDGVALPMRALVERLNDLGGRFGVGRFNGLEAIGSGFGEVKNHEVREAPAACAILEAHRHLEIACLTTAELRVKAMLDAEWITLAVHGHWHSTLKEATEHAIAVLSREVEGRIVLRYRANSLLVVGIDAPRAMHYWNLRAEYEELLKELPMGPLVRLQSLGRGLRPRAADHRSRDGQYPRDAG